MDRYSRIIAFLKVLLPLASLALLSTLFLISKRVVTEPVIPFTQRDIDARLRGQQVTNPHFTGTTANGHQITISANKASPGNDTVTASAEAVEAEFLLVGGKRIHMVSDIANIRPDKDIAILQGNVNIASAGGLQITTDRLEAALNGIEAQSPGRIHATGPIGDLTAGTMRMFTKSKTGTVHIEFTAGVKLVYNPTKEER